MGTYQYPDTTEKARVLLGNYKPPRQQQRHQPRYDGGVAFIQRGRGDSGGRGRDDRGGDLIHGEDVCYALWHVSCLNSSVLPFSVCFNAPSVAVHLYFFFLLMLRIYLAVLKAVTVGQLYR